MHGREQRSPLPEDSLGVQAFMWQDDLDIVTKIVNIYLHQICPSLRQLNC